MKYCKFCGAELDDDSLFCPSCGKKQSANQAAPAPNEPNGGFSHAEKLDSTETFDAEEDVREDVECENNEHDKKPDAGKSTVDNKKRANKIITFFSIIIVSIAAIFFIVSMILTYTIDSRVGNVLLIIGFFIDFGLAALLFFIVDHRMKYICPNDGTKRIHHRRFLYTNDKVTSWAQNDKDPYNKTEFTHYYEDTYVCPKCGETMTIEVHKSGGYIIEYYSGRVSDHRLPPQEY